MKLYTYLLLLEYYKENNSLKEINNNEHDKNVLDKEKVLYNKAKNNNEDWINNNENLDEQVILNVAKWSKCQISPICSFLGGIVSQEVIKETGKYIPINRYFWIDFFETIEYQNININRGIFSSKYDALIDTYGQQIQKN